MIIHDLETRDDHTAGIRYVMDLEAGFLAMDGHALLIAGKPDPLRHWLHRENPQVVEPTTEIIAKPEDNIYPDPQPEATSHDPTDDQETSDLGDPTETPNSPDDAPTHPNVVTRIKARARANTKVRGRRVSRRRNSAGKSIL